MGRNDRIVSIKPVGSIRILQKFRGKPRRSAARMALSRGRAGIPFPIIACASPLVKSADTSVQKLTSRHHPENFSNIGELRLAQAWPNPHHQCIEQKQDSPADWSNLDRLPLPFDHGSHLEARQTTDPASGWDFEPLRHQGTL
jgi:hypothetical protein